MSNWTKYNMETGEIIGWSSGLEGDETPPGPDYVASPEDDPGHPDLQYVKDGQVCMYTESEILAKLSMPAGWVWDVPLRKAVDTRTLLEAQNIKWTELKEARTKEEFGPFTYNGMVFDGDADAQRRLNGYISVSKSALAAGQSFSREYTLADNNEVTLTAEDFIGIELAKITAVAETFAKGVRLRERVFLATSNTDIATINW